MRRAAVLLVIPALLGGCATGGQNGHISAGTRSSAAACRYEKPGLPDAACTPGAINPAVIQADTAATICTPGWTATERPPTTYTDRMKRLQMAAYGSTGSPTDYEEDHRIPLEVGGNPTAETNLWPEAWAGAHGAHAKDRIENRVHRDVCDGTLTLAQGQAIFTGDWWTARIP